MIHGYYLNSLSDIYSNYKKKYVENKQLLKDNSPKTVQAFMQNFMEFNYLALIKNSITYDNFNDFVDEFFIEFFNNKAAYTFQQEEEEIGEINTINLNNIQKNDWDFSKQEEFFYLKIFFFENCLIVFKLSENCHPQTYSEILNHFFNLFIKTFDISKILNNFHLFNFILKNVILVCLKSIDTDLDISTLYEDASLLTENENKRNLINLLFINKVIGVDKDHGNYELEPHQVKFITESFYKNIDKFIDLLLNIKPILNLILPNLNESQLLQIKNHLILIYKKIFRKLKSKKEKFNDVYNRAIEVFIIKLSHSKLKESEYEQFVFLFEHIFIDTFENNNLNIVEDKRLGVLFKIMQSNQPVLHKLSVNMLEKIRNLKIIDNNFLDKFISVFDVLDGYNSHLFKSLWNEFENVILFCENYKDELKYKNKIFMKEGNPNNIKGIFSNPFNYFKIISNKIKNHENVRIQKFFIKSFSNVCMKNNLNNKNFVVFIYSTLLKMLNNALFYPENESISFHTKIGIIIENFYTFWLDRSLSISMSLFEENINLFLKGIVSYIKSRRIFNYLINSLNRVFDNKTFSKIGYTMDLEVPEYLFKMIEINMKYLSVYQKQKCWETIDLILRHSNILIQTNLSQIMNFGYIIKLFYHFINYFVLKETFNYMSVENVNLMDSSYLKKLKEFINFFIKLFLKEISTDKIPTNDDDILNVILSFKNNNKCLTNLSTNEIDDLIITLFWFTIISNNENKSNKEVFINFMINIKKLTSSYNTNKNKLIILHNFRTVINLLDIFSICFNIDSFYFNYIQDAFKLLFEYHKNLFKSFCQYISEDKQKEKEITLTEEYLCLIQNSIIYEEIFQKSFSLCLMSLDKDNSLSTVVLENMKEMSNNFKEDFNSSCLELTVNKIKVIHFISSFLKVLQININLITHFKPNMREYFTNMSNFLKIKESFNKILDFLNKIEELFDKNKSWIKDNNIKDHYNQVLFNIIKFKTLMLMTFKEIPSIFENENFTLIDCVFNNNPQEYGFRILDFLEKSNEDNIYYIFKFLHLFIFFYCDKFKITEEFYKLYVKSGIKTLTEKRNNLNYINTLTYLSSFINNYIIKHTPSIIPIISETLKTLNDLNEKRTWLVLKLASDLLLNIIQNNIDIVDGLSNNIVDLAECKETRGEDTTMLQTNPQFLFSPFNVTPVSIFKNNLVIDEEIFKYGLYIRLRTMNFFDNYIKNSQVCNVRPILNLISNILKVIDSNSTQKTEMQFTTKHRKKLRLSQFLLILSQIFKKMDIEHSEHSEQIEHDTNELEKLIKIIFEKVNLYSVRFYFDLFCLNFAKYKKSFIKYLISVLSDPNAKTHCVTSSLIILSILLLERTKEDLCPSITQEIIQNIYETITSLCTSNICNIRGFAQYFVYRLRNKLIQNDINLHLIEKINISEYFYEYLSKNTNIQRFFKKFNENYNRYTLLVRECNIENILNNNFDAVNCEIMPSDFIKEFKEMALNMVELENEDLTKPHISWRVEGEAEDKQMNSVKISEENLNCDFQKKYRPIEEDDSKQKKRKRLDVVVMASLIDKAPNLGGLTRTCEVFNIGAMTLNSETFLNDNAFLTAAASAERWLPIMNLPTLDIERFIRAYRKLGYKIIGLEQTANSIQLKEFKFTEKCVIVLGNEKEGIPQNLIQLIDYCVIIPQFGEIRSLNVHVSAALMLWELVNSCTK